jgi:DNA-directed RNA polymerase specialized sigma24 family protein
MPRKKREKNYYGLDQEQAVVDYLNTSDQLERDKIFNQYLKQPLSTMIDCIIRRYGFQSQKDSYDTVFNDTFSFLLTKFNQFLPAKNKKSYSYYQTIIKNFLLQRKMKEDKELRTVCSYDDIAIDIDDSPTYSYSDDDSSQEQNYKEWLPLIKEHLNSLHWYNKIIWDLHMTKGLSVLKIAQKIGIPHTSVASQLREIKQDIRDLVHDQMRIQERIRK